MTISVKGCKIHTTAKIVSKSGRREITEAGWSCRVEWVRMLTQLRGDIQGLNQIESGGESRIASERPSSLFFFVSNCHLVLLYPFYLLSISFTSLFYLPTFALQTSANFENFSVCTSQFINTLNTDVLSTYDMSDIKQDSRGTIIEVQSSLSSGNYSSKGNKCIDRS